MRPLKDLVKDETFIIGRVHEEFPELSVFPGYYNQKNPLGMLFCRGRKNVLQIYTARSASKNGRQLLLVEKKDWILSDELLFEILTQIEEKDILQMNYKQEGDYSLFRVCYQ